MEDVSVKLELTLKLCGVRKLTRGRNSHSALYVIYDNRLSVDSVLRSESTVSYVTDSHITASEICNRFLIENVVYES